MSIDSERTKRCENIEKYPNKTDKSRIINKELIDFFIMHDTLRNGAASQSLALTCLFGQSLLCG